MTRVVPVRLQEGKWYVTRDGGQVRVEDNPHWQCRELYPFWCEAAGLYYKEDGSTGQGEHPRDIVSPYYANGGAFVDRTGRCYDVVNSTTSGRYTLSDEEAAETWTEQGQYHSDGMTSDRDLMDYAPAAPAVSDTPDEPLVGKRIKAHGNYGVVVAVDGGSVACRMDPPFIGHACGGYNLGESGWYYHRDELTVISPIPVLPLAKIADDPLPAPVEEGTLDSENIGKRVQFDTYGYGVFTGTIVGVHGVNYAVEVSLPGEDPGIFHSCEGKVAEGRGWFVGAACPFEFIEDEAPVSKPQAPAWLIDGSGRHDIWIAYTSAIHGAGRPDHSVLPRIIADYKILQEM